MEHNKVHKIPFGAFSKAKYLVSVACLYFCVWIGERVKWYNILIWYFCFQTKLNMKDNQIAAFPLGENSTNVMFLF